MLFSSNVDSANLPLMDLITGTFFPYRAVGRFENPGVRDSLPNGLFHFGQLQGLIPVQCCWKVLKFGGVSGDVGA